MKLREWLMIEAKAGADVANISIFDLIGGGFFADEDATTGKKIAAQLDVLPESIKTIRVHVNSPGGAVFDAIHIANALRRQRTENKRTVEMLIEGMAASAATIITSAGNPIKIAKNAVMMTHMPTGVAIGPPATMRKTAEALERVADGIIATYRWVSPKSADELRELMEATTWMSAEEAVENGFATEIMDGMDVAALLDPEAWMELVRASGELRYPESIRARLEAFIAKPAPTPIPADPTAIIKACKDAALPELAADLLGHPLETVHARLTAERTARTEHDVRATEIRRLCSNATVPQWADRFIAGGMPAAEIKPILADIPALMDRAEIDSRLHPQDDEAPDPGATWAAAFERLERRYSRKGVTR